MNYSLPRSRWARFGFARRRITQRVATVRSAEDYREMSPRQVVSSVRSVRIGRGMAEPLVLVCSPARTRILASGQVRWTEPNSVGRDRAPE